MKILLLILAVTFVPSQLFAARIESDDDLRKYLKDNKDVTSLDLGLKISDAGLRELKQCTQLSWLDIHGETVTDEGIRIISQIKTLTHLSIYFVDGVTDASLPHIGSMKGLRRLSISSHKITGIGLRAIADLPKLSVLHLQGKKMDDHALLHASRIPNLLDFTISTAPITNDGMKYLAKLKLTSLSIIDAPITSTGVWHLAEMTSLRQLRFYNVRIGSGIFMIGSKLSQLTSLHLTGKCGIAEVGIETLVFLKELTMLDLGESKLDASCLALLATLPKLKHLSITLSRCAPVDADLAALLKMKTLDSLGLYGSSISDKSVEALAKMKGLEFLDLGSDRMTKEGFAQIQKALPKTDVSHSQLTEWIDHK